MAKADRAFLREHKSYSKRMSDHVAYALVVYTLMLIFVVTPAMESKGTSIFPYFLLVGLVALVIPACRNLERKWQRLSADDQGETALDSRFAFDRAKLWIAAVAIPFGLSVIFRGVTAVA